ncbi:MAG TPA: hypothetical protein VGG99_09560 [Acetobacteraceae bacterium]|jgi:hypothetical protein
MNDWLSNLGSWVEHHPGAASWAQAVGATLAVIAAVLVPALQARAARRQRDADRQLRAKSLAIALYPELLHVRAAHRRIQRHLQDLLSHRGSVDLPDEARHLSLPISDALRAMVPEFYLLGEPIGPDVQKCIGRSMKYNDVLGPLLRARGTTKLPRLLSFVEAGLAQTQTCIAEIAHTFGLATDESYEADDMFPEPATSSTETRTKETV